MAIEVKYGVAEEDILFKIQSGDGVTVQRYDRESKEWVDDYDLLGVFEGRYFPAYWISEEEAMKMMDE